MSQASYINSVRVAIVLTILTFKLNYAQDSIKKQTNIISISSAQGYNNFFKTNSSSEKTYGGYNYSYEINYENQITNKIGLILDFGFEKRNSRIINAKFDSYWQGGSHGSTMMHDTIYKNINAYQTFLIFGLNPYYSIINRKIFNFKTYLGIRYLTPFRQSYNPLGSPSRESYTSFLFPSHNYKFTGGIRMEHILKNSIVISYSAYYDIFLNKSNSNVNFKDVDIIYSESKAAANLRYWGLGLKISVGYKW